MKILEGQGHASQSIHKPSKRQIESQTKSNSRSNTKHASIRDKSAVKYSFPSRDRSQRGTFNPGAKQKYGLATRSASRVDTGNRSSTTDALQVLYLGIDSGNLDTAISAYNAFSSATPSGHSAVGQYVMFLTRALERDKNNNTLREKIVKAVRKVHKDSISNAISPSAPVYKRLISFYDKNRSWTEGTELWKWMTENEEEIIHFSTYAAAIEFFTHKGAFAVAEAVYQQALASSEGSFLQYHLTPNATLLDREAKDVSHFPPDAAQLIAKNLEAKLRSGDIKGAYLLLDSSLRVLLTADSWAFSTLYHHITTLTDRYTIIRLALRAGVNPGGPLLGRVCSEMFMFELDSVPAEVIVGQHVDRIQGLLNLIIASYDVTGFVDNRMIHSMLRLTELMLLRAGHSSELVQEVADNVESLFESIYPLMKPPTTEHHITLLGIGRRGHNIELIKRTLNKILQREGALGIETSRALLASIGGASDDVEQVKTAWYNHLQMMEMQSVQLAPEDWIALRTSLAALSNRNHRQFMVLEAKRLNHVLDSQSKKIIDTVGKGRPTGEQSTEIHKALARVQTVFATAQNTFKQIRDDVDFRLDHNSLSMDAEPSSDPRPSLSDLFMIYDKVSVDPATREQSELVTITFDNLAQHPTLSKRFHNWATITELLIREDARKMQSASEAVQIVNEETGLVAPEPRAHATKQPSGALSLDELTSLVCHVRGIPMQ